jgi:release factor glutamine methyltransferase
VSPEPEPWSIRKVLSWASDDFRRRGNPSARLDAELLLAEALGVDRIKLIVEGERPLGDGELARYRELIKRRRSGEPIAYILGRREFFALPFRVDAPVLIPRPDTELLVETALNESRERSMFGRLLDLCTGSGCVAIAFARERPTWRVTAVDLSRDAVAVARDNAARSGVARTVAVLEGDLFAALAPDARFELITANPPYIPSAEVETLELDIRGFEPRLALDGGTDGLEVTRRVISGAAAHLAPGGLLALEIGSEQGAAALGLLEAAGFSETRSLRDLGGHERVVCGRYGPP